MLQSWAQSRRSTALTVEANAREMTTHCHILTTCLYVCHVLY